MKTNYLLPPSYKKPGMVLSLIFACGCLYVLFSEQNDPFGQLLHKMGKIDDAFDEICVIGLSIGLLLTVFSREKTKTSASPTCACKPGRLPLQSTI